jgi:pimeloyl-ACP methyl ester carboxylesterase
MPEVVANGIKQCYEINGEGRTTIVWIHGIGGSHHYWDDILPSFPGFRHISYDVRGMGDSEGTDGPASLETWAADCNALLEELGVEQAIIAGTSMGGAITQRVAIDYPGRVNALLLLSTSSRVGQAATDNWMAQADRTEAEGKPRLAAAQRAVAAYNMDEELKSVAVPTLIIVGDADKTTPAGGSVIISRCIANSELEIYPGIGHGPLKEEPKAVERVRDWLQQFA